MIEIVYPNSGNRWNDIVRSFDDWDVYYLEEYSYSLKLHEGGEPLLFYYTDETCRICYVAMKKDIANDIHFSKYLDKGVYFDIETPYGYGGPIFNGDLNELSIKRFWRELTEFAYNNNIVTQFIRIHPLLCNRFVLEFGCDQIIHQKDTIFIDTSSKDVIFKNMHPKTRNMVKKAQKMQVKIAFENSNYNLSTLFDIYRHTMQNNNANSFYYFDKDYFDFLSIKLKSNVLFAYGYYESKIISGAIFLYNNKWMHYHLSGTYYEYRNMASTSLMIYEAAMKAYDNGIKYFHLGGGVERDDDLFFFKKRFNINGQKQFFIARTVFNDYVYEKLVGMRSINDPNFRTNNKHLIKYRG